MARNKIISLANVRSRIGKCEHTRFQVDEQLANVECLDCGERVNPMYVLARMAHEESMWLRRLKAMRVVREKLDKRKRCKCDHCGKMTEIRVR